MKKLLVSLLCVVMMVTFMPSMAFAAGVTEGWEPNTAGETDAVIFGENSITVTPSATNGAFSKTMRANEISEGKTTYEAILDLSEAYQHGELFCISLGLGEEADTYGTEFMVQTVKDGDKFKLTAGVDPGKVITINEPGVYTYRYTVNKANDSLTVTFDVAEIAGQNLTFSNDETLNKSKYVRYLWVFGRAVDNYSKLDRNLVMYKNKVIPKIEVSDLNFKVGNTPTEFTVGTIANHYKGTMVKGKFSLTKDGKTATSDDVTVEYWENAGSAAESWQTLTGDNFGPDTGFPLDDFTSKFRAKFKTAGEYKLKVDIVPVNKEEPLATEEGTFTVAPKADPEIEISDLSFKVDERKEFTIGTKAKDYAGTSVKGTSVLRKDGKVVGADAVAVDYYEPNGENAGWHPLTGDSFGPSTGFPLDDFTSKFRATFKEAGKYTLEVKIVTATEPETVLATKTVEFNVAPKTSGGGGGIVIPPTAEKPIIEAEDGATVTLSKDGKTATIVVDKDATLTDVILNGKSLGPVTEVKGLKTGDKLQVIVETAAEKDARIKAGVEATTIKAWSKRTSKGIKVYFKKSYGFKVDGYEIYRSVKKSTFGEEPYYVSKNPKAKYLNNTKNLKKGKYYFYKIRGYRTVGGEKVYTQWSNQAIRLAK